MKRFKSALFFILSSALFAQTGARQPDTESAFAKQAHELMHEGKYAEALAIFQNALRQAPTSREANIGAGVVLDLLQRGAEARKYFEQAIESAPDEETRAGANRSMAISWAFDSNCQMTVQYEQKVLDYAKAKGDYYRAGEIADEEARVCMDTGDIETSMVWYEEGRKLGLQEPNLSQARKDLWDFRFENAQARAAIRSNEDDPMPHIAAAKAILDRGTNPDQQQFMPALTGYVAFYQKNFQAALNDLQKANQNDPFIECLMAQAYENLGQKDKATEFYRKAAFSGIHNPSAAYAIPFSEKKLGIH